MTLRLFVAVLALFLAPMRVLAQQEPVFDSYDAMRAELDQMMMAREIKNVLLRFGGSNTMTEAEIDQLQVRMRQIYPFDFRNVAVIDRNEMDNGFAHEIYAYWTGLHYLYVLVFLHETDGKLISLNLRFNTDFYELIGDL